MSLALAGGGIIRRENIYAPAAVVIEEHPGGLSVFRTIAVYNKGDAPTVTAAGYIMTAEAAAASGKKIKALLRCCSQLIGGAVAELVIALLMASFIKKTVKNR